MAAGNPEAGRSGSLEGDRGPKPPSGDGDAVSHSPARLPAVVPAPGRCRVAVRRPGAPQIADHVKRGVPDASGNGVAGRVTGDKPGMEQPHVKPDGIDLFFGAVARSMESKPEGASVGDPVNPQDVSRPRGESGNAHPAPSQKAHGIPAPSAQESGVDRPELAALKRLPPSDPT